ncbi:MAG: hypothetical protein ABIY62_03825 [Ginsengibacter sp.]
MIPYESNIPVNYNEANRQLLIDDRQGNFDGMIKNRVFEVTRVNKKNRKPCIFKIKLMQKLSMTGRL